MPDEYRLDDLELYKIAREFRKKIYKMAKLLPDFEKFNVTAQMRDAARSVTNNIAEGHGRFHYQENIQFCRQSRGSVEELLDDLNICIDERYTSEDLAVVLKEEAYTLIRRINGYIFYLSKQKKNQS